MAPRMRSILPGHLVLFGGRISKSKQSAGERREGCPTQRNESLRPRTRSQPSATCTTGSRQRPLPCTARFCGPKGQILSPTHAQGAGTLAWAPLQQTQRGITSRTYASRRLLYGPASDGARFLWIFSRPRRHALSSQGLSLLRGMNASRRGLLEAQG